MAPSARTPSVHLWFQPWVTSFAGEWKRKWTELRRNWMPWREQRRTSKKDTRNWKRWCLDWTRKWWEGRFCPWPSIILFRQIITKSGEIIWCLCIKGQGLLCLLINQKTQIEGSYFKCFNWNECLLRLIHSFIHEYIYLSPSVCALECYALKLNTECMLSSSSMLSAYFYS